MVGRRFAVAGEGAVERGARAGDVACRQRLHVCDRVGHEGSIDAAGRPIGVGRAHPEVIGGLDCEAADVHGHVRSVRERQAAGAGFARAVGRGGSVLDFAAGDVPRPRRIDVGGERRGVLPCRRADIGDVGRRHRGVDLHVVGSAVRHVDRAVGAVGGNSGRVGQVAIAEDLDGFPRPVESGDLRLLVRVDAAVRLIRIERADAAVDHLERGRHQFDGRHRPPFQRAGAGVFPRCRVEELVRVRADLAGPTVFRLLEDARHRPDLRRARVDLPGPRLELVCVGAILEEATRMLDVEAAAAVDGHAAVGPIAFEPFVDDVGKAIGRRELPARQVDEDVPFGRRDVDVAVVDPRRVVDRDPPDATEGAGFEGVRPEEGEVRRVARRVELLDFFARERPAGDDVDASGGGVDRDRPGPRKRPALVEGSGELVGDGGLRRNCAGEQGEKGQEQEAGECVAGAPTAIAAQRSQAMP